MPGIRMAILLVLLSCNRVAPYAQVTKGRIAIFGSSVANGSGDTTGGGGYSGMLKRMLEPRGWEVVNLSKGGDNTTKILPRFTSQLLPAKPDYVVLALSLGNEGIATADTVARERNFERFRSGMLHLIRRCRENGMVPVVVNCYARMDFGPAQHEAVQKMNMLISDWEVPSINVLGTIDDGSGRWVAGYAHDNSHPDIKGHTEMFCAFVPSLFDALQAGKKIPEKPVSKACARVRGGIPGAPFSFIPDDAVRSFSLSFMVKTRSDGTIASINSHSGNLNLSVQKGKIMLGTTGGCLLSADTTDENKGWQYVTLTYQHARGRLELYVNGKSGGSCTASFTPVKFFIGGNGGEQKEISPEEAYYKDLMIWRSALNPHEVTRLYHGGIIRSSLEIYAPLDNGEFPEGGLLSNLAQSMSNVNILNTNVSGVLEINNK